MYFMSIIALFCVVCDIFASRKKIILRIATSIALPSLPKKQSYIFICILSQHYGSNVNVVLLDLFVILHDFQLKLSKSPEFVIHTIALFCVVCGFIILHKKLFQDLRLVMQFLQLVYNFQKETRKSLFVFYAYSDVSIGQIRMQFGMTCFPNNLQFQKKIAQVYMHIMMPVWSNKYIVLPWHVYPTTQFLVKIFQKPRRCH